MNHFHLLGNRTLAASSRAQKQQLQLSSFPYSRLMTPVSANQSREERTEKEKKKKKEENKTKKEE